ncbi:D-alanyl-D-alanine carboxypeptidase [Salipaludibacillus agaradhaerens]|uniref:D-alanyl-D-alanine carboxypeptidase family protein n=1 Tax=Salipaludibacillus agaradhaerens TaxID=76935 RepID=UPI002151207E|nr:D-alanyl-D-alanine carboxypeptidase family protein [Salipaludibacillus agaradhaerens]MCR6106525.1 D-alanyl-D-alanine carboxypeptidase [Salipaludibacillus agaradhaerens]MCR6118558.1 D-alanyl-D-alanine carboxypeptidase [Salipaludibacillus agaradhaerens]
MRVLLLCVLCFIFLVLPAQVSVEAQQQFAGHTSAKGAVLIEQESGRVLYEKQARTPMRIASITKIMTAILAIESGKLDEEVTISSHAYGTEGSSIYLAEGEKIILRDLVYGLMLRSGNDAAVAIAEHIGGSVDGFVYLMNEKAREIGMEQSVFSNPHGLDDHEEHYSTAYDMAILTQYAMDNPVYQEISGTTTYRSTTPEKRVRVFNNKNKLLTQLYKHSTGGKTGYTKRAKRTLVSTAEKEGMSLIAVTINAPSDWNDHINLFEWAFGNFEMNTIVSEGIVTNVNDSFYENKLHAQYTFGYPLSKEDKDHLTHRLLLLRPNLEKWEKQGVPYPIGSVQIELYDDIIGTVPIKYIYENDKKPSFYERWFEPWLKFNEAGRNG